MRQPGDRGALDGVLCVLLLAPALEGVSRCARLGVPVPTVVGVCGMGLCRYVGEMRSNELDADDADVGESSMGELTDAARVRVVVRLPGPLVTTLSPPAAPWEEWRRCSGR